MLPLSMFITLRFAVMQTYLPLYNETSHYKIPYLLRKFSAHILTGASLCLFLAIGSSSVAAICLLVLMMAFNGAAVVTVLVNTQDLAPNWSGTLYGIMNFFGGWGGFVQPILVEKLTRENTIGQWAIVFTIGGAVGIVTGIIFILFGSTELQSWNQIEEEGQSAK